MKRLKRKKDLTHVRMIRIASIQIIRILVKIKAVSEYIKFQLSKNRSLKPLILRVLYKIITDR